MPLTNRVTKWLTNGKPAGVHTGPLVGRPCAHDHLTTSSVHALDRATLSLLPRPAKRPPARRSLGRLGDDLEVEAFGLTRWAQAQIIAQDLDATLILADGRRPIA
jgi:hypothetical protein